ncbi:MAG: outer membrane protein assembly factor BamD [Bacteroidota bacterium]|jgi:outer membrane protein assembly factor BamD
MKGKVLFFLSCALLLHACTEYGKAVKETDPVKKLASAKQYYEDGEYYKALPMFEELVGLTRGKQEAEEVYYYFAKTNFGLKDYYSANYYFKAYAKSFKGSKRSEECLFMAAMSSYQLSPNYSLDQLDSQVAIDEFQYFLDQYPTSSLRDSANKLIEILNFKVEKKDFEVASLYVKTEKYKAATYALQEFIKAYPQSQFKEEAMYLIIKSKYLLADGSVDSKKLDRFRETIESYITFVSAFPKSKYLNELDKFNEKSLNWVEQLSKQ